jgi:TPP-dependent pyruvate/acetoin dehydrogenase alpha subunit
MGTALERYQSETNVALKAAAYKIASAQVDGMDVEAVEAAALGAVDRVRRGGGPQFLEFVTYRFRAHSMFDPELYRSKAEVERWKKRDPIVILQTRLTNRGWIDEQERAALDAGVDGEIAAAVAFAEAGSLEPVSDLLKDVMTPQEESR